jgi:hypothetical protein
MANLENENELKNRQNTPAKAEHQGGYNDDMGRDDTSDMDLDMSDDSDIDTVEERGK